ncbi:alpha/beta hydrolase [Oceanibacterium hippocampi]|uniref:Alpha/beta hydrolase family protein n=1 Tax=Oceanibacterium hippocampi TaxID=745714 RepID=A0A1Y5S346_9PROT|nr:alpha/beta hydrolase [Oceanibacterium hippocampi]SLN30530.1 Alpha/beta hydrolase family protein [Oceanibacterium hippocampi]
MSGLETWDHFVESSVPGCNVLLRNTRRTDGSKGTVLCIHGATYPSIVTFDYSIDGRSWLEVLAEQGYDAWCIDLPGYGGSDRPPAMQAPPEANPPIVDTAEAEATVLLAIDYILAERFISKLSLIGYSWGSAIAGGIATKIPRRISRLVMLGALWIGVEGRGIAVGATGGAYRLTNAEAAAARWRLGLTKAQQATIAPPGHIEAWADRAVASDPASVETDPPILRAPTGVIKDVAEFWQQGKPTYDPGLIEAPTLIVVGEWDHETTPDQGLAVFGRLERAAERRYLLIGRATHSLPMENQRHALHASVGAFLGEDTD